MNDEITISRADVEYLVGNAHKWQANKQDKQRLSGRAVLYTLFTLGLIDGDDNITDLDKVSAATNFSRHEKDATMENKTYTYTFTTTDILCGMGLLDDEGAPLPEAEEHLQEADERARALLTYWDETFCETVWCMG